MRWGYYYMKNFIKGKWFPLVLTLLALVVVAIIAFLLGFRITYAPELENSWDAISGVAAWISVLVSVASVFASVLAVRYAISVADDQNKITLFEKRYELYALIHYCEIFAHRIEKAKTKEEVKQYFLNTFSEIKISGAFELDDLVRSKFVVLIQKIEQLQFMLIDDNELSLYLTTLSGSIHDIIDDCLNSAGPDISTEKVQNLLDIVQDKAYNDLLFRLIKDLALAKVKFTEN